MDHAVSPNRPQAGTRGEPPAHAVDLTDAWTEGNALELSILPALEEDAQDPHNIDPQNGPNHQGAGNGDEDAATELLQQIEQEDLRGVRSILGQQIPGNVITARHFWQVVSKLRVVLFKGGLQKMENGQDYARVLERLARVITIPGEQDYISAPGVHPLGYKRVFEALGEMTPDFSCPLDSVECLDRLREDLTATSSVIRAAESVFVIKDREQYARRLRALAAWIYTISNV